MDFAPEAERAREEDARSDDDGPPPPRAARVDQNLDRTRVVCFPVPRRSVLRDIEDRLSCGRSGPVQKQEKRMQD